MRSKNLMGVLVATNITAQCSTKVHRRSSRLSTDQNFDFEWTKMFVKAQNIQGEFPDRIILPYLESTSLLTWSWTKVTKEMYKHKIFRKERISRWVLMANSTSSFWIWSSLDWSSRISWPWLLCTYVAYYDCGSLYRPFYSQLTL